MENEKTNPETTEVEKTTTVPCDHCKKIPKITKHIPPNGQRNFNAECACKKTPLIHGENAAEKAVTEWESKYYKMDPTEVNKESGWAKRSLDYETELKACTSCGRVPEECKHCEGGGSVYYNIECACKKTPLIRSSMGADAYSWNEKYFEMDPESVNKKAGYLDERKNFHYYT